MSFLGNLLKGVAKVAKVAAPFIPGVGGIIAGGIGALGGDNGAGGQASAYANDIAGIAKKNQSLVNQYYDPLFQQALALSKGGNNFIGTDPYGLIKQAKDLDPYGLNATNARTIAFQENRAKQAGNEIDQLTQDLSERGIAPTSSGAIAAIQRARTGQYQDNAAYRREASVQNQQDYYNRLLNAENLTQGYGTANQGFQLGNTENLLGMLTNLQGQNLGQMGGLQQYYQSKSDAFGGQLGDLASLIGKSGILDQIFKKKRAPTAGNNTLGTNQTGSTPSGFKTILPKPVDYTATSQPRY